jgi:hypothetical protein
MIKNIFKYAAKYALRFPYKGQASVEDLFNLNLNDLDAIYKNLVKQQKADSGESLIETKTPLDTQLEVKIAIVKEIFADKKAAMEKAKATAEKKAQTQKILDIMARKQDEALLNMSLDELQAQLASIDSDDADTEDI